jgi:hypothetical protein
LDWQDRVQQLFLDKEHERLGPRTSPKRLWKWRHWSG